MCQQTVIAFNTEVLPSSGYTRVSIYHLFKVFLQKLSGGVPGDSVVKNLPANAGDPGRAGSIPGREEFLEKKMATHSSILAWEILRAEEPSGPQFMRSQRVECNIAMKQQQQSSLVWLVSIVSNFLGPLIFYF